MPRVRAAPDTAGMPMTSASFLPRSHRLTAIGVTCLTLFGGAAGAQTPPGASVACEQWAILSTAGQASGRVEVCSRVLQEVPRLREQIAYLNQRAGSDADARRDLQRFAETLNQMARQLKAQDVQNMADNLVARLAQSRRAGDSALMDELDRLRLGMREVQRTLQEMRTNALTKDKVEPALSGEAGASIAKFDFDTAKSILGALGRIEAIVTSVDRKVTELNDPAEARVLIASERRRATQQMERFVQAGAEKRCGIIYRELLPVLKASELAEQEERFAAARRLLMTVYSQAIQATAELQRIDMQKAREAEMRVNAENDLVRRTVEMRRRLDQYEDQVQNQEKMIAENREYQQRTLEERESVFRSNWAGSQQLVVEAKDRLAGPRAELREAQALGQASEDQKARRQAAIEQARQRLQHAEQQVVQAQGRVAKELADFEEQKRSEHWPTAPNGNMNRQIDSNVEQLRRYRAARDYLAAAITKAIRDGKDDPARASEDLRLAEGESSDIYNGVAPMPRPRRGVAVVPAIANAMCV